MPKEIRQVIYLAVRVYRADHLELVRHSSVPVAVPIAIPVDAVERRVLVDQHPRRNPARVESVEEVLNVLRYGLRELAAVVAALHLERRFRHDGDDVAVTPANLAKAVCEVLKDLHKEKN